jgi:hypothetical protein
MFYEVRVYKNSHTGCIYVNVLPERVPDSMLATSSYCHDKSTGMIVVIK